MTEKNKNGNYRGQCYEPRWHPCKMCGEMFWKTTARREYCDKCKGVIETTRARDRYLPSPYGIPKRVGVRATQEQPECLVSQECRWGNGAKPGCDYVTKTGKLRTLGGKHPIINGRCDLFEKKKKGEAQGWQKTRNRDIFVGGSDYD